MAGSRRAEQPVGAKSQASTDPDPRLSADGAEASATAAWSLRVRRVGGLIQTAFAAFWLVRGSVVIGGAVSAVLIAVFGVAVVLVIAYAKTVTAGMAPRPRSPEGRRIERAVTVATVVELIAAFILPVVVVAAGHSDWVLPSIAITIGPRLPPLPRTARPDPALPAGGMGTDSRPRDPRRRDVGYAADRDDWHRRRDHPARYCPRRLPRPRPGATQEREGWGGGTDCPCERACTALSEDLHVVFGAGQVGSALSARLSQLGLPVRVFSRNRPTDLAEGVDWRSADATDADAATDATAGAAVVYQCLNAPYTDWPERFPPLQRGVLTAAERNGALLVTLENIYAYGPTAGKPMTEDTPLAATTNKGRARAAMTEELLSRLRGRTGARRDRAGIGLLRPGRHRNDAWRACLRQRGGREAR